MRKFCIIDAEQRSPAWFAARLGRITGSKASDILGRVKSGDENAARRDYRMQLVCERLTGQVQEDGYVNAEMQRGIDLEPAAFDAYEALTGNVAARTGFLASIDLLAGCSLDGHVGEFEGIVEVKCPKTATHVRYLREGGLPKEHAAQVRHNLWVTGAKWCDFLSYDDRLPPSLRRFYVRVTATEMDLPAYEVEALKFLAEVDREYRALLPISEQLEVA